MEEHCSGHHPAGGSILHHLPPLHHTFCGYSCLLKDMPALTGMPDTAWHAVCRFPCGDMTAAKRACMPLTCAPTGQSSCGVLTATGLAGIALAHSWAMVNPLSLSTCLMLGVLHLFSTNLAYSEHHARTLLPPFSGASLPRASPDSTHTPYTHTHPPLPHYRLRAFLARFRATHLTLPHPTPPRDCYRLRRCLSRVILHLPRLHTSSYGLSVPHDDFCSYSRGVLRCLVRLRRRRITIGVLRTLHLPAFAPVTCSLGLAPPACLRYYTGRSIARDVSLLPPPTMGQSRPHHPTSGSPGRYRVFLLDNRLSPGWAHRRGFFYLYRICTCLTTQAARHEGEWRDIGQLRFTRITTHGFCVNGRKLPPLYRLFLPGQMGFDTGRLPSCR